jgi:hypothetical protein
MSKVFDKLAEQEEKFLTSEFFSPVIAGRDIRVSIAGVVMRLSVKRPNGRNGKYEGWGVFKPRSYKEAVRVRDATLQERQAYLDLFPAARIIVCARDENKVYGVLANSSDPRFKVTGLIPVHLAENVQLFETIQARFDGSTFWFDRIDMAQNPRASSLLRDALTALLDVEKVNYDGITKDERRAYAIAFLKDAENRKDRNEERIKSALQRAGASYRSYVDRGDSYTVEYTVDGQNHHSVIKKDTLEVQSAGICLSGGDRAFDLQSLVGVIREGIRGRRIVNVGINSEPDRDYDDDDY